MKKLGKSLRARLFLWYVGSQLILVAYFLVFIHYYSLPHDILILTGLFIILAAIQFMIIYKITKSIIKLSSKIKIISSKNLEEKISDIDGINGEDEIGELARSFNNLLNRLSEAFQRERQFVGDLAHELKTPLATLRSSLEVALSKKRSEEEYGQVIEEALIETDDLTSTLKNVLDLAWSEAPNEEKNKKRFNLTELVNDLYEIAQKTAVRKKIKVSLFSTPGIFIDGFKDKLARALLNIIDNAIKYSSNEGKIELILEKTPNKILISIIDNGVGIQPEDLPHIFDRFYRGSKTDKVLGSGLGLAITKSIVGLHDGEIKVKSVPQKGTTFIVVLPRT